MGDVSQLGAEVMGCFGAAIAAAALKVTRGVIAARRGFEELAANVVSLQEAIKLLPSELFRTCLAKVCLVDFISYSACIAPCMHAYGPINPTVAVTACCLFFHWCSLILCCRY